MTKAGLTWWKSNDSGVASLLPGIFPEPDKDPVIQIASMVQRQGETEPFIRTVFTLQSCASIVGSQILCFTQETKLLQVYTCTLKAVKCIHSLIWFLCFLSSHIFFVLCLYEQSWAEFLRTVDPDIITGYNIQNFDFPYLLNRAAALKVRWSFIYFSPLTKPEIFWKDEASTCILTI